MVLLTMTPSIVEGLKRAHANDTNDTSQLADDTEPALTEPEFGKPIAHRQIIQLSRSLRQLEDSSDFTLEKLLRGSEVYTPPPPPKTEPTPEFKALMARLRHEEEERTYQRMVNASESRESFYDRFPHSSRQAFASVNQPTSKDDLGDDDVTYEEVHRQVMLIINFVVSILGVAGTLWVVARWWSTTARLLLTMSGSIVVAIAEVAVYLIYVMKMGDAKKKQGAIKEVKEVVETWVVGKDGQDEHDKKSILLQEKESDPDGVRKRNTVKKEDS
ncbi:unnamed protein product [Clonostachys rosea]|uniref:Uncharacterized protein n=1 Tax=Bionectria ochroleuca TaxID=29856 RepID=A0ABY6U0D8_BIOOC|nr:unnamed protein product [Clonostachys rosea]